jgi:hypothetical protein
LIALVLVAVAAGGFAIAFRATLAMTVRGVAGVANLVEAMTNTDWWWRLALPMIGAFAAGPSSPSSYPVTMQSSCHWCSRPQSRPRRLGQDSIYMAELRARGVTWELTMAAREVNSDVPTH